MYIKPGQTTAIVGPTGAGKTTIVKLLMRFYELNAGAIYIDGHNITDYTRSDLRNMVGMVLQDAWLFEGSILENLRFRFIIINNCLAFYTINEEKQTVIVVRFLYKKSNWCSILRQGFSLV